MAKKSVDILLYGVFGDSFFNPNPITINKFYEDLKAAEETADVINIRINSPGGSTFHGNAIFNAIKNSKKEVHIWNDGTAFSMGCNLFFAVPKEQAHAAKNSLFLLHSASFGIMDQLNAKDLRNLANDLDKFDESVIQSIANRNDIDIEKVRKDFFDYEDHLLTAQEFADLGFCVMDDYEGQVSKELSTVSDYHKFILNDLKKFNQSNNESGGFFNKLFRVLNLKPTNTQESQKLENKVKHTIMPRSINTVKLLLLACAMAEFECKENGNVEFTPNQLFQVEKHLEAKDSTISNLEAQNAAHAKAIEAKDAKIEELNAQINALQSKLDETPVTNSRSNAAEKVVDVQKLAAAKMPHNIEAMEDLGLVE